MIDMDLLLAVGAEWFWQPLTPDEAKLSALIVRHAKKNRYRWYHGGSAGLPIGTDLLPPSQTGLNPRGLCGDDNSRKTHVFFSSEIEVAQYYASKFPGGGEIYRVKPVGKIEADPEVFRYIALTNVVPLFGGLNAFRAKSARIVARVRNG